MTSFSFVFSLLLLLGIQGFAQKPVGNWYGSLKVMGTELPIVFHLEEQNGQWTGTMDSPNQGAEGIPLSQVTYQKPDLSLEVGGGMINYSGTVKGDQITGIFEQGGMTFFLNLSRTAAQPEEPHRPQQPKDNPPYESEDVVFNNPSAQIQLAGTLTFPQKEVGPGYPTALLISGSGAQDRNETISQHQPFWVLADFLTRQGIAVLRVDDRGTGKSEGQFQGATSADFATDVAAAVAYLKTLPQIDPHKIGLIGHSEGGIIAPMVASKDTTIAFLVLLAAPGYDGAELLLQQNAALAKAGGATEETIKELKLINKKVYQIASEIENKTEAKEQIIKTLLPVYPESMNQEAKQSAAAAQSEQLTNPWMVYFLKNNPQDYLLKTHCPVLAIGGSKDLQVPAEENLSAIDSTLKKGGNTQVQTVVLPQLNHLFQTANTGLPTEYGQIEETFSPKALTLIANWILKEMK